MRKINDHVWETDGEVLNLCNHDGFKNFVDFTKDGFVTILNAVLPQMTHAPSSTDDSLIAINVSPSEHYKSLANSLVGASLDDFEETGRAMVKLLATASVVAELNNTTLPETKVTKLFSVFVNNAYNAVHCSMDNWLKHQEAEKFRMELKNLGLNNKSLADLSLHRGFKKTPTPQLNIPWIMRTGVLLNDSDNVEKNILNLASQTILKYIEPFECNVRIYKIYMRVPLNSKVLKILRLVN